MKIACQSCQAKYTIADEKVLGRVVKIRCKKCGATIVINGNEISDTTAAQMQPPPGDDPTAVQSVRGGAYDYAAPQGEEWTINVADGDQRTMLLPDVVAQFKAGVINDETYCWKDGMSDWLPLREIEPLATACGVSAQPPMPEAPPPAEAPAAAEGLGALFGGGGGTPYPSPAQAEANGGGLFAAGPASAPAARRVGGRAAGGDLFSKVADAGGENDVMTSAPQGTPQMHEEPKLTGQRNENSVLFSLAALTQNAPKEEAPAPQDGSGLIDIRALASTMKPKDDKKANHVDDIMNLGGGGAFSAALAAPVLAPPPVDVGDLGGVGLSEPQKANKLLLYGFIGMAFLFVVMLFLFFHSKASEATDAAAAASASAAMAAAQASAAATDTASAAPVASAAPTDSAAAPATAAAPADTTASKGTSHKRGGGGGGGAVANAGDTLPPPPPTPASRPQSNSLEAQMGAAVGATAAPPPPPPQAQSSEPFDRGAAAAALGGVNVQSCKRPDGPTGSGHVSVTFAPSGGVVSAVADQPPFAGTAVGGCVAAKFRSAHVPPFGGGSVKVGKSFVIN